MICRKCHTDNLDTAHYCSKCGNHLARRPAASSRRIPWYVFLAGGAGLLAIGFFLSALFTKSRGPEPTRSAQVAQETPPPVPAAPEGKGAGIAAGDVVIEGPDGRESSRWAAAPVDGAWVALPAWALLDAGNLSFSSAGAEPISIGWAVWADREPVVLCRLDEESGRKTPRLSPWRPDVPLLWRSLEQDRSSFAVGGVSPTRNGSFLHIPLPEQIRRAGLFLQEDTVVGWTFGSAGERGYLWQGEREIDRAPRIRVSELSGSVLSNGREARIARALAADDQVPAVEKLRSLAEGFRAAPLLDPEDTPLSLRPRAVVGRMHELASALVQAGAAADVVRVLDDATLLEDESMALVKDAVLARAKSRDYEYAIGELERLERKLTETGRLRPAELSLFKAQLYKDWLKQIIDRSGAGGMEAFEKAKLAFPNDLDIHLLGVEIAILERNWPRATEFLQMRDYPAIAADRVKMLENLIQEGQKDEGVGVLRFDPGTDHIPVQAYVNGKFLQKFIIDTGATASSIPWSTVDALGLKIDDRTNVVVVEGVTGRGLTYEITLDSIELAGQRVYNVKAFVIDMASYKDCGLLGQNVLNNFQLDIDYKKGILRIKKR
jgi:clan AA aspartic protease (TIGR02281 family)